LICDKFLLHCVEEKKEPHFSKDIPIYDFGTDLPRLSIQVVHHAKLCEYTTL